MRYFFNVLVSVDQLGNTICAGNPDSTISARVGYFSTTLKGYKSYYWKSLEKVINVTFWPVDGPNHCKRAYLKDKEEVQDDGDNDWARVILSIIIALTCIPISIVLYLIWGIKFPFSVKNKNQ